MFSKKSKGVEFCSNRVAVDCSDIFSGAKAKLNNGIATIKANSDALFYRETELLELIKGVQSEIEKDKENILMLESKVKALDSLV